MSETIGVKKPVILVILAAGSSRRFQGNKLLHDFYGKPMYRHLADQVKSLGPEIFAQKIIVTQYAEIEEDMSREGYCVVKNTQPELGISHSIHLAIRQARRISEEAALCFAVCDQPYLKADTLRKLVECWRASGKGLGCLGSQGELGNPAIFDSEYQEELLGLTGDVGGKKVIRRHMKDLFQLEVEDKMELVDIDVREA